MCYNIKSIIYHSGEERIMTKDLTRGTPWRLIVQFALPIMAGNLLQQLYNIADTIIVGNFNGQQALSAGMENISFSTLPGEWHSPYIYLDREETLALVNAHLNPYVEDRTAEDLNILSR